MSTTKHLYAEFRALPGEGDAVASLVAGYRADVSAEPGNLRFDAHRLVDDPDQFFVYEVYADEAAFQTHIASAHCAKFNEHFGPLVTGGTAKLTWLNPIPD